MHLMKIWWGTIIMNRFIILKSFFIFSLLLLVSSCATKFHDATIHDPYGFFSGFLHGAIWLPALIISFFDEYVAVIGEPNTGLTYFLGFFIAILIFKI